MIQAATELSTFCLPQLGLSSPSCVGWRLLSGLHLSAELKATLAMRTLTCVPGFLQSSSTSEDEEVQALM
jgi:hypothetical protein